MIDPNSSQAVSARDDQEDPIVMYLIVRESLGMSIGKTAAQVGHAVGMLFLKYSEEDGYLNKLYKDYVHSLYEDKSYGDIFRIYTSHREMEERIKLFQKWMESSFRKVVLRADENEWKKLKTDLKNQIVLVVDSGLTELPPSTETVIGVFPMYKSQRPKILKRLQALK